MTDLRLPNPAAARLADLGVALGTLIQDTGKTLTYHATHDNTPVVVKVLVADDPMWVRHQQAEQSTYRVAAAESCPLRIPTLRYGDNQLTVLDHLDGQPLHTDRYPGPLQQDAVHTILDHLEPLYTWQPTCLPEVPVTHTYIAKHAAAGLLTHADSAAIRSLISPRQLLRPEHGDTHAANFLLSPAGVGVVDLEHLARHLAGHDWALMQLLWGPANPWLGEMLVRRAERDRISGAYAANLALLACREWTIHHHDPASAHLQPVLDANLRMARQHLQKIYSLSW